MTENEALARINTEIVAAMKAQDAPTLSTLRMLKAALMEAKTKKAKDATLSGDEEIEILQRYVKKRREAIEEFRKLGRDDLIGSEEREIAVTMRFLPQPLGEDEVRAIVREVVAQTGASGPQALGKVMGPVMARVKGKADGGLVSRLVKEALTESPSP
jgi:uncharacterized protein